MLLEFSRLLAYDDSKIIVRWGSLYRNISYQRNANYKKRRQNQGYLDSVYMDYGPEPFAVNINKATMKNNYFRTALWTGHHLQLTLMSINPGEDIGFEMHPDVDQFICIEDGQGLVKMGDAENMLDFEAYVSKDYAFIIPAGKWHNLINIGGKPIKLFSIYAPPQHPHGTIHQTRAAAHAEE